jgi:hypothetical protein
MDKGTPIEAFAFFHRSFGVNLSLYLLNYYNKIEVLSSYLTLSWVPSNLNYPAVLFYNFTVFFIDVTGFKSSVLFDNCQIIVNIFIVTLSGDK